MNRRGFLRLAVALPVVGPAAIKAAAAPSEIEILIGRMRLITMTATPAKPVFYMNKTMYEQLFKWSMEIDPRYVVRVQNVELPEHLK